MKNITKKIIVFIILINCNKLVAKKIKYEQQIYHEDVKLIECINNIKGNSSYNENNFNPKHKEINENNIFLNWGKKKLYFKIPYYYKDKDLKKIFSIQQLQVDLLNQKKDLKLTTIKKKNKKKQNQNTEVKTNIIFFIFIILGFSFNKKNLKISKRFKYESLIVQEIKKNLYDIKKKTFYGINEQSKRKIKLPIEKQKFASAATKKALKRKIRNHQNFMFALRKDKINNLTKKYN